MKFLFSLILLFVLGSCGAFKKCDPEIHIVEKTVVKREVIHDTIFKTAKDSSQAKFELVTDQKTGQLKPVAIQSSPGRILNAPTIKIKDNILTVDCRAEADELFAQWKETYTDSVSKTTIVLPPKIIEKELSLWQSIQIWLGRAFILLVLIALFLLFKKYWPK